MNQKQLPGRVAPTRIILFVFSLFFFQLTFCSTIAAAYSEDIQYLPADLKVDPKIPTPKQHLGFRVGERHIQHHQLVSYLRKLAGLSPRFKLKIYAYTHGGRPCIMLTITSVANHKRISQIRSDHLKLSRPGQAKQVDTSNLPAVINMGYSVHGDESSASNAAIMVAYYLAAAKGKQIDSILDNCVVLMDPCLNPDGLNRFASWANGHVGRIQNADPSHVEHNQPFPGGRVNYYWFDLNRDWLPAQHPESQGRLTQYHSWKPNVVLDFHEMGTNSSYFFQPGIPTRNNPLTPKRNYELTHNMARYHAKALDKIGSLYMTEERFDDFYMGKGSTYPDLHGSVGILFEQASSRGHRQESINGELTFPFTIRNQVTTSLTSLQATVDLRKQLLDFKKEFYSQSLEDAKASGVSHFEFRCENDPDRLMSFATVLLRHDIRVFQHQVNGHPVLVVPVRQPEYRFLQSLTEKRTNFRENIFYDVSTWHLPSAFGVEAEMVKKPIDKSQLAEVTLESLEKKVVENARSKKNQKSDAPLAYVVDWRNMNAPELISKMLRSDVKIRVARKPFSISADKGAKEFPRGTMMIPNGIQKSKSDQIRRLLEESDVPYAKVNFGLTPKGIDLGSSQFSPVKKPSVAMLIGDGVSRYEAGEVWHLFDTRLKSPLTMIDTSKFSRVDLARYTTMVMVSGSYSSLSERQIEKIKSWTENGGNLVLCGSSILWAKSNELINVELVTSSSRSPGGSNAEPGEKDSEAPNKNPIQKPFDQARSDAALQLISGAIFQTKIDLTHPLGFGYSNPNLRVFRNNKVIVKPSSNPYVNAAVYTEDPQVAGYCSAKNVELLKNSAAAMSMSRGRGTVMVIPQNPNFRAFWYGTNRLFINAVLLGNLARN